MEHKEDKTLKPYKTKNNEDTNGINMTEIPWENMQRLVLIGICFGGRPWEHKKTSYARVVTGKNTAIVGIFMACEWDTQEAI